jgi:hypothetical protein
VSGTAYDTANRPLSDVLIQVVGGQPRVSTVTDLAGRYELPGTFTEPLVLRAEKPGYVPVTVRHWSALPGPTRRDIFFPDQLDLVGEWSITVTAHDSCHEIPQEVRTRVYMASIHLMQYSPLAFEIRLRGATLVSHWSNTVWVLPSGADARFEIPAWDWGLGIAEDLGDSRQLSIWGEGTGSVTTSTMAGVLTGGFEFTVYAGRAPSDIRCESFRLTGVKQ